MACVNGDCPLLFSQPFSPGMRDWKRPLSDFWTLENKVRYCNFQGATFISLEIHITINVYEIAANWII